MKRIINLFVAVFLLCFITGCGELTFTNNTVHIVDYGDAEAFEAALNAGENLEGKIVRFKVSEFHPTSEWGYNLWAGEHLNFVSSRNPDIKEGDEVVVKATLIESVSGSWKISYEKIANAVDDEHTIYSSSVTETESTGINEKNDTPTSESPSEPVSQGKVEEINGTFTSNQYYDVVEEGTFTEAGYTVMIYKVLAKQNISLDSTMLAYSPEGSVIGKSSSEVTLTEGEYNYFRYSFQSDISNATFETTVKAKHAHDEGDRNAVEMVDYNVSGDDLYIILKQVSDNLGQFAKFKILYYNGDQIIGDESGRYVSIYAENLSGKDSTDVVSFWVYGKTFDRIEFIFEP